MADWTKEWAEHGGARTALSWWERACAGETITEIAADHDVDVRVVAYALAGYAAGVETSAEAIREAASTLRSVAMTGDRAALIKAIQILARVE